LGTSKDCFKGLLITSQIRSALNRLCDCITKLIFNAEKNKSTKIGDAYLLEGRLNLIKRSLNNFGTDAIILFCKGWLDG
jgi:hypothetical protein